MQKQTTFKCWNCIRTFKYSLEITDQQTLVVKCPHCQSQAVADLSAYPRKKVVLRSASDTEQVIEEYQLPEILPTQKSGQNQQI
ncbi:MAG: hypothetical protein Q8L87_17695 [Anaerolineales bacterium]|jgi:DNA-directed RNA polymerase subunit RPC12/RpoP|nr:hypothetical protein [Anaerolineales bacterium]